MNKAIITTGALALLLAGAAAANDHSDKFAQIDSNGDGVISQDEFTTYATASGETTADEAELQFSVIAGDDAEITQEELTAAMEENGYDETDESADADLEVETEVSTDMEVEPETDSDY